ncbi:MAG: exodeoxyribonuclease VII small subunit [Spirochaetia bacterium]|nr:exodeoxyribonuclease VII small subunit [Spirochaetia bacterium]
MTRKKEPGFEEAIDELEEITRALESGELSLDDSIKSYEKGMELKKLCLNILEKAEKKLEYLEKSSNDSLEKKSLIDEDSETSDGLFDRDDE